MFIKNKFQKMVSMIFIVATLLSSFQAPSVFAQGKDGLKRQINADSGRVSFIGPESGSVVSASKALGTFIRPQDPAMALANRYAPEFGIKNPGRELYAMKTNRPEDGHVTVKYQQKYQGIPVMGGELIVNTNDNGDLYSMNGEVSPNLSLPTQPTIASAQATQTALQAVAKWYQKASTDFVATAPALWIYDESLLKPSTQPAELVWRMEVTSVANSMPVRELVLVNAQRGSISLHFNQIDNAGGVSDTSNNIQMPVKTVLASKNPEKNENPGAGQFTTENIPALVSITWYVATTGNDNVNSCSTPASPCLTINGAIGKAASGDTIKVGVGTYTGSGTEVVLINKSVTLSGGWNASFTTRSGMSTINGQNVSRGVTVSGGVTTIVEYFTIQNGIGSAPGGHGAEAQFVMRAT